MKVARLLRTFGNITGGGGGGTVPAAPVLVATDRHDGSGADGVISGSTGGSVNNVYRAALSGSSLIWVLTASRGDNGAVSLPTGNGEWFWQVRSVIDPITTTGSTVYQPTTGTGGAPGVFDRADGTGLNVVVAGTPGVVYTAQIRDASQGAWRDSGQVTGSGTIHIPPGGTSDTVSIGRTYWVRLAFLIGGDLGFSGETLATPTENLASDIYPAILAIKHELIAMNLARIGGNVHHCIDPRGAIAVAPTQPAIWVFQPDQETPTSVDNRTTRIDYPIEIGWSDTSDTDWVADLQWWSHIRFRIFWHLHRLGSDIIMKLGFPFRQFRLTFGNVRPDDPAKYMLRYQSIRVTVDVERLIGG